MVDHRSQQEEGEVSLGRRLGAGVLDSGLSSATTMLTALYAVRFFSLDELGAYAVFFSAFVLGAGVVSSLVHTPAEVAVLDVDGPARLMSFRTSAGVGAAASTAGGLVLVAGCVLWLDQVPLVLRLQLALPALALVVLSPAQDHARRLLHSGRLSTRAAGLSALHLATVAGSLLAGHVSGLPTVLVPGGALVVGNLVTLAVALDMRRRLSSSTGPGVGHSPRGLLRDGRWIAAGSALAYASPFVVVLVLASLLDIGVVGTVEGVRVLGQPLLVLGTGLLSVLTPRLYRAGREREGAEARRATVGFSGGMLLVSAVYGAAVVVEWPGNPLPELFPAAYATEGLLAAHLGVVVFALTTTPLSALLIGASLQGRLLLGQALALVASTAAATSAVAIGAFAAPASALAAALCWAAVAGVLVRSAFRRPVHPAALASASVRERPAGP